MDLIDTVKKNSDVLYGLLGAGVLVASASAGDIAYNANHGGSFNSGSLSYKAEFIINSLVARATGYNPFPNTTGPLNQSFKVGALINGASLFGAGLWVAGEIFDGYKYAPIMRKVGAIVAITGAIGGALDPAGPSTAPPSADYPSITVSPTYYPSAKYTDVMSQHNRALGGM